MIPGLAGMSNTMRLCTVPGSKRTRTALCLFTLMEPDLHTKTMHGPLNSMTLRHRVHIDLAAFAKHIRYLDFLAEHALCILDLLRYFTSDGKLEQFRLLLPDPGQFWLCVHGQANVIELVGFERIDRLLALP